MRTLIQGGWVVGFDGRGHELIPNGAVVYEGAQVIHVGGAFDGAVDRTIDARGKLVCPGFINCHLHAAVNAGQTVFIADGKLDYFGSNFIGYVAPRRGAAPPRTKANARDRRPVRHVVGAARGRDDDPRRRDDAWRSRCVHHARGRARHARLSRPRVPSMRSTRTTAIACVYEWKEGRGRRASIAPSTTRRSTTARTTAASAPRSIPGRWTRARRTCSARRDARRTS